MGRAAAVLCLLSASCAIGESLDSARASTGTAGNGVDDGGETEVATGDATGGGGVAANEPGDDADGTAMDAPPVDVAVVASEASDTGSLPEGSPCTAHSFCGAGLGCKCCSQGVKCICAKECASDGDCKSTARCSTANFCAPDGFCG
jgi:hypothetical protein